MLAGSSHQAYWPLTNTQGVVVVVSIVSMLCLLIVFGGEQTERPLLGMCVCARARASRLGTLGCSGRGVSWCGVSRPAVTKTPPPGKEILELHGPVPMCVCVAWWRVCCDDSRLLLTACGCPAGVE